MKICLFSSILLVGLVQSLSKQQTLENLVYPWPSRPDWPSLKMSYNYILSGYIQGSEVVKDGTYSYSKDKGYHEPKVEQQFQYYTLLKTDAKNDRAVQKLWANDKRETLLAVNAIDF
jgi:hypothetical protein